MTQNGFLPPADLRWLYVDFNSYFASVEQQLDPRLRNRPVIVIPAETDATSAIAASYEAKAFGIRTGTPVWEAKKICPDIICVLGRHDRYVEFHENIIDEIDRHIQVTAVCSIDEMACRLMKNETTPARLEQIAKSIKEGLRKNIGEYVRCSIGVAPSKYLAKVATDLKKPDGFTILHPHDLPHRLLDLKLRDLPGIGPNVEKRLKNSGIFDMQMLLNMQPKHMRAVWGSLWGEKMFYYLRGFDLPDTEAERSSVGHSHVLSPDMRPPEKAYIVAQRLTMKAAARLRRMEYCAGRFSLSVRTEKDSKIRFETSLQPAQDSSLFLKLLSGMWDAAMKETGMQRLKKVSVVLSSLKSEKDLNIQPDLFAYPAADVKDRDKSEKLSKAMDKLNHKFGKDTVLMGMTPQRGKEISGTKIAFTRIPDMEEFAE